MELLDISEQDYVSHEQLADEYPQSKQRKLRILNYLRQHYLRIILALIGLTVLLILLLTLSIVLNILSINSKMNNTFTLSNVQGVSAEQAGRTKFYTNAMNFKAVTGVYPALANNELKPIEREYNPALVVNENGTVIPRRNQFETKQDEATTQPSNRLDKITCHQIKCEHFAQPCNITTLEYAEMKRYSCCGCLGDDLRLVRYEKSEITRNIAIIIAGAKTDPCQMSEYDLQLRTKLSCLKGNWDVQRESDALCYLRFNLIGTCPYVSDE